MKIIIVNGSARKGNTLSAIDAFVKGASEKMKLKSSNQTNFTLHLVKGVESVNVIKHIFFIVVLVSFSTVPNQC